MLSSTRFRAHLRLNQVKGLLGASLVAQMVRIHLQCRRPWFDSWVGKFSWRRDRLLPTPVLLGFPSGSDGKESACNVGEKVNRFEYGRASLRAQMVKKSASNARDSGSIPGSGRFHEGGHGNLL